VIANAVISGEEVSTDEAIDVYDPSSEEIFAQSSRCRESEIDAAVRAAHSATDAWRATPPGERGEVLRRLAWAIRSESEELSRLESVDTGKPLAQARTDVEVSARYFEFYGSAIETYYGISYPFSKGLSAYTQKVPYGVTGHIIPWNYPMQIASRTIAPSLAVGNCVVVKPAEDAPMTVVEIARLATRVGLPPGVLNVVPGLGEEAGRSLAAHPKIGHLSFTGSVEVGAAVAREAAANVIPVALELGGKSPNIIFADADLDTAVPVVLKAFIQNAGQTCSAGSRLLMQESVAAEVLSRLSAAVEQVTLGPGLSNPDLGPLISAAQLRRVRDRVSAAEARGVKILSRGLESSVPNKGWFFPPTIVEVEDPADEIARSEVFGPVAVVQTFTDVEDAIAKANATEYALLAGVWTRDVDTAFRAADGILAGQVYINNYGAGGGVEYAFGGFRKSGYGREKGREALDTFCQSKTVIAKVTLR
jgi:aldehyde dehydrogenase (NAD+)